MESRTGGKLASMLARTHFRRMVDVKGFPAPSSTDLPTLNDRRAMHEELSRRAAGAGAVRAIAQELLCSCHGKNHWLRRWVGPTLVPDAQGQQSIVMPPTEHTTSSHHHAQLCEGELPRQRPMERSMTILARLRVIRSACVTVDSRWPCHSILLFSFFFSPPGIGK